LRRANTRSVIFPFKLIGTYSVQAPKVGLSILLIVIYASSSLTVKGQRLPPLKISDNRRYFVTQENEPFFWLGDTAWELIHRLNREETDLYLTDRKEKGFTIIQTVILAELDGLNTPNAHGHKPLIDNDPTQLNEKYFEHLDYVLKKAEELGLYVGLLPSWGDKFNLRGGAGPLIFTPENAETYGELIAQRYADQDNIIWILGGDRMPENELQFEIIRAMARGIRKADSVRLITFHPPGAKKATDIFNETWLDFDMFQSGHDRRSREFMFVNESKKVEPVRPVVNGEPRYENIPERFWEPGEHAWLDDSDVRVTAYWSMLTGAAGYTYGCNDIWQMYSLDLPPVVHARTGWQAALQLPGARQLQYMKDLLTAFPWQTMLTNQKLIVNDNPENHEHMVSAIGENGGFMIAYTPWGRPLTLDLSPMKAEQLQAYWYNPRSGESLLISEHNRSEKPTFTPWASGRGSDFVLVVLARDSPFQLPGQQD